MEMQLWFIIFTILIYVNGICCTSSTDKTSYSHMSQDRESLFTDESFTMPEENVLDAKNQRNVLNEGRATIWIYFRIVRKINKLKSLLEKIVPISQKLQLMYEKSDSIYEKLKHIFERLESISEKFECTPDNLKFYGEERKNEHWVSEHHKVHRRHVHHEEDPATTTISNDKTTDIKKEYISSDWVKEAALLTFGLIGGIGIGMILALICVYFITCCRFFTRNVNENENNEDGNVVFELEEQNVAHFI